MSASISSSDAMSSFASVRSLGRPRSTFLRDFKERAIVGLLVLCGAITISITVLIVGILVQQAAGFFGGGIQDVQGREANVGITDFLFSLTWNPLQGSNKEFGIWPLIIGTFQVTIVAMLMAIPIGLMVAIWLSEYASTKIRSVVKPLLEVIAGIPTVVFGYFALTFVTPLLQLDFAGVLGNPSADKSNPLDIQIFNVLAAGLTVGIMCIPIVTSLSEDAIRAVPRALREGAYGMGASRFETSIKVVFPAALSGIVAACLLAFARAVGETMIVAIAAGLNPPVLVEANSTLYETEQVIVYEAGQSVVAADGLVIIDGAGELVADQGTQAAADGAGQVITYDAGDVIVDGEGQAITYDAGQAQVFSAEQVSLDEAGQAVVVVRDLALGNIFAVNEPTQTMTGYMVSVFFGDLAAGTVEYQSVYAVGMTLFLITLAITLIGAYIRRRFQQQYE